MDIFQHSPLCDVLNSLRSLTLSRGYWPYYVRLAWDADDDEIRSPPTTHLIAIVDDFTDMLDFGSEDIDGMDDDAGEEEEPPPTRPWTATTSYDIYMVDTPKESVAIRRRRIIPPRSNPSTDVSGAALSPAIAKAAIPTQETIMMQTVPKTIPSSQASSGRMGKLALRNRRQRRIRG